MFDLSQLLYFVTIVEQNTISKAAEVLLVSQPALTRSLKNLEETLEVELFDRKKNKITLNDNGKLAYEHAKKILEMAHNMKTALYEFDRMATTISIGSLAPAPIWALTYLFKQKYPGMVIEDVIGNSDTSLIEGLKNNQYNIIVLNHPYEHNDYLSIELFTEKLYLSVPPAHPLAMFKEVSFQELNGESILLMSKIGVWNEINLKYLPDSHLLPQNDETVFNEIRKASALPHFRTDITILRNNDTNRVNVPITDDAAKMKYYAVFHKDKRKLFEFIEQEIKDIDWKKV
ncbi:MAG: LysR family transcriptional regulator [Erysipelotrichaceae bacterium]|nr:LysR family transcriptional regulator [Erysipelotrichaceae bacterium]MDD3809328.1 LysR family transcriptional regulator [Erysipelotrichaceae bacterium]